MKNSLKINAVAIVAALSVISCNPPKAVTKSGADSLKADSAQADSTKQDITAVKASKDTGKDAKKDIVKK